MIRKKLVKVTMYALLPSAVSFNLALLVGAAVWDGCWELVDIIRTGGRG